MQKKKEKELDAALVLEPLQELDGQETLVAVHKGGEGRAKPEETMSALSAAAAMTKALNLPPTPPPSPLPPSSSVPRTTAAYHSKDLSL